MATDHDDPGTGGAGGTTDSAGEPARRWVVPAALAAVVMVVAGTVLVVSSPANKPPARTKTAPVVEETAVTAMDQTPQVSHNSPVIAADPDEPRFVVMANRRDAPDFGCGLQVSGDRGRTWLTATPVPKLPKGAEKCYAPEVAFGTDRRLYYLFVGLHGEGNEPMGVFVVSSMDSGRTFTSPRRVLGPLNFAVRMAIDRTIGDRGRLHLVWLKATSDPGLGSFGPPPNPILSAYSDDGGKTFSKPVQVSDPARQLVVAPALALGPDHSVHVAYYDLGDDARDYHGLEGPVWEEPWSLVLSSSFNGGRSFGKGKVVDGEILPSERVMLIFTMPPASLVAGSDGKVCAAWTDARNGDADALLRCSNDGGTWRAIRRLNDDPVGNGTRQYLPRISLSPDGRLDAVFFDRRDDRSNLGNSVYFTSLSDGGRPLRPNLRISGRVFDTRIGAQYANVSANGLYEIGARLGLLSERSRAVAAWPDARYFDGGQTGHDLLAATVVLPDAAKPDDTGRLAGSGLIAAGAALFGAVALARRRRRRRRRGMAVVAQ